MKKRRRYSKNCVATFTRKIGYLRSSGTSEEIDKQLVTKSIKKNP